jgi:hypothetical protein
LRRLEVLALDADDVARLDLILGRDGGGGLSTEDAHWRKVRRRRWIAAALVLALAAIATLDWAWLHS